MQKPMDEYAKWNAIILSIRKAARILRIYLTETDMPEHMNWFAARTMHRYLWDQVYLKNITE